MKARIKRFFNPYTLSITVNVASIMAMIMFSYGLLDNMDTNNFLGILINGGMLIVACILYIDSLSKLLLLLGNVTLEFAVKQIRADIKKTMDDLEQELEDAKSNVGPASN